MNIFSFTGNLGRDAETRHIQSGTAVASFPVAVTSGYGDRKSTTWVRCNLWGNRAEGGLVQYLTKGQQVAISGEVSLREWDKDDGSKGFSLEVNVSTLDLIGGRQEQRPAQQPAQHTAQQERFDDDIPF